MISNSSSQNVFYPSLQEFCRKFLIVGSPQFVDNKIEMTMRWISEQHSLFEQFLLFDRISFKVDGENAPLSVLLNFFGERDFEELLEQNAIKFVLWNPLIAFMKTDVVGVNALASGTYNLKHYNDPQESVELGLRWMTTPPVGEVRRKLVQKVADQYEIPHKNLAGSAVGIANSAFNSGKFKSLGLSPEKAPLDNMPVGDRERMCKCASEIAEYCFLMERGMTSFSTYEYFTFFSDSLKRFQANGLSENFAKLSQLQGLPDLKNISASIRAPLHQLPKLRQKTSSQKFRKWLATNTEINADIAKEYINDIADAKGILDSVPAKIIKSVAMATIGAGMGAMIEPHLAVVGAIAGKAAEPLADVGLDLADKFLLEGYLKGWTPKLFFDDLKKLSVEGQNEKAA